MAEEKFFNRVRENQFYKKWFKSAFTYVTGAVLLSVLQVATLASTEILGEFPVCSQTGAHGFTKHSVEALISGTISAAKAHNACWKLEFSTILVLGETLELFSVQLWQP